MYNNRGIYGVTSTLIYGVQWDAIMNWIDPEYKNGNCIVEGNNKSFVANSTGKGFYGFSEPVETGSSIDYAINNIYDLAGNVWEWTMESNNHDNKNNRSNRGGGFLDTGVSSPASIRSNSGANVETKLIGFRVALYL